MSDSRTNLAPSASSQLLPQGQPAPPREPFSPNATGSYEHHIDLSAYPMEPQSGSPPLGNHTNVYPEDNSEGYPRKAPLQKLDVSRYLNNNSITANLPWVDRPIENPGLAYADRNAYRHRDALSRIWTGPEDDRYLSATDGRLRKLIVQATNEVRCGPKNGTWSRRGIRSVTPIHMRVVYWVLKDRIEGKEDGVSLELCLKWFPACLALLALLFVPADLGGEIRNNGRYEQFKYHFWGYPYIPSNPREAAKGSSTLSLTTAEEINGIAERPLRPRYLCFLTEDGVQIRSVADWEAEHGREAILQYLFISYTSAQFQGPADWDELHVIAAAAAQTAGVSAYWISCSCMPEPEQVSEDVYRISDIVRGAHSLAVILGPPVTDPSSNPDMKAMLQNWGERMWTFPEVLLSPAEKPVAIYTRGGDIWNPHFLPKRNFPAEAWTDAPDSRQLVDHYEGSVVLSPLELVTLALQCLSTRANNTTAYLNGDLTYVLMGLLRRRPRVNSQNTAFQEFCRLSLANDSNRLLERLICLLPRNRDQPWHHIDDAWARSLWDITPLCQVDGVGENDTVILGGGFAAPIRWKSFTPVNLMLRKTLKRLIAQIAIRGVPGFLVLGAFFLGVSKSEGGPLVPFTVLGWLLMIPAIIAVLCSPYLLGALYTGKPWRAQPWLFGFEGYMDKAEIETMIFGTNLNRFKWSPYSSELSRHESVQAECIGVDPTLDPAVRETLSRSQGLGYGAEKVFTLVDTNLMTVTLFTAVRPPVALVLCGSEGGMQRGLLCSYDWKTQTLYKESVLRVDTMVLEKMSRVDRFRLGLRRPLAQTVPVPYTDTPIV